MRRPAAALLALAAVVIATALPRLSLTAVGSSLFAMPSANLVWTIRAPMPTARYDLGAVAADNGMIYAIGGWGGGTTVEEYDPTIDSWRRRASMPTGRAFLGVAGSNGKVYAIGGSAGSGGASVFVNSVEEYDPATDSWRVRAGMPTARTALGVATAGNGKILAVGGGSSTAVLSTVEEYDPATNSWTAKSNMPTARTYLGLVAASNGKIYAIGGVRSGGGTTSAVEEYDPVTGTWRSRASMPTALRDFGAAAGNNMVYVVGGSTGSTLLSTVMEYDPASDTWRTQSGMQNARRELSAVVAGNGRIYAIGGFNSSGLSTVEEGSLPGVLTSTATPSPTATHATTATSTPVAAGTQTPTGTTAPTPSPTLTHAASPTAAATGTPTAAATVTWVPTPTATGYSIASPTATAASTPTSVPVDIAGMYEENSTSVLYGGTGWTRRPLTKASGGWYKSSAVAGDWAEFWFLGTGVRWHALQASDRGTADLYVDGVLRDTYDLFSANQLPYDPEPCVAEFAGLGFGIHVIRLVVVTGRIDVDAFYLVSDPTPTSTATSAPLATATIVTTPTQTTVQIPLHIGWNWIAYLPRVPQDIPSTLSSIDGKYDYVLGESGTYAPPPAHQFLNNLYQMEPGKGYLIRMKEAATLVYEAGG